MISINYLKNKNVIPKVVIYIAHLSNKNDRFVKIGTTSYLNITYAQFRSFGYKVREIEKMQFSCKNDAINEIKRITNQYQNFEYIPMHKFPEPSNCYGLHILDGMDLKDISDNSNHDEITEIVMKLFEEGLTGNEIAKRLNISESKVSTGLIYSIISEVTGISSPF